MQQIGVIISIIVIIIIFTPGSILISGVKTRSKSKCHWLLEIRIFVSWTKGIHNEDWVEVLPRGAKMFYYFLFLAHQHKAAFKWLNYY